VWRKCRRRTWTWTPMLELLTFIALVGWALYGLGKIVASVERIETSVKDHNRVRSNKHLVRR